MDSSTVTVEVDTFRLMDNSGDRTPQVQVSFMVFMTSHPNKKHVFHTVVFAGESVPIHNQISYQYDDSIGLTLDVRDDLIERAWLNVKSRVKEWYEKEELNPVHLRVNADTGDII